MVKIIEIFKGIQGEGPLQGRHSIFIRLCGCNMRCKFGCKNKEEELELEEEWKKISDFSSEDREALGDFPLLKRGCDSYPAILPEIYNKLIDVADYTVSEMVDFIRNNSKSGDIIVWTGGEPLLQYDFISKVCLEIVDLNLIHQFETNGTIEIDNKKIKSKNKVYYVISPKPVKWLLKSDDGRFPKQTEGRIGVNVLTSQDEIEIHVKLVVNPEDNIDELLERYHHDFVSNIWLMPEGGEGDKTFFEKCTKIADICVEKGLNFSPRLQNWLWKNGWGK
jgi:organic radical activating enzyme